MGSALLNWLSAAQVNVLEEIYGGKFLHNCKYLIHESAISRGCLVVAPILGSGM